MDWEGGGGAVEGQHEETWQERLWPGEEGPPF